MPPNRNHPETLHYLARLLVGVREADQARQLGGLFYDNLIQRVKDVRAAGLKHYTQQEASDDLPGTPAALPAHPRRDR
jgi:hypothetical protein